MYIHIYLYVIPQNKRDLFLEIIKKVREKYEHFGALEGEHIYIARDANPKYGCLGLTTVMKPARDEEIWMGIIKFENAKHAEEVLSKTDADPEVDRLYDEFVENFQVDRILRCEFGGPVG